MKQKATNKQTNKANKFIDTDNSMKVTRGEGGWGKGVENKGGPIYGEERRLDWVVSTQCNTQTMYHGTVRLKQCYLPMSPQQV